MVQVNDRYLLQPSYTGDPREGRREAEPGTVIQVYPRFAVIQFDTGFRECFLIYGGSRDKDSLSAAPRAGRRR